MYPPLFSNQSVSSIDLAVISFFLQIFFRCMLLKINTSGSSRIFVNNPEFENVISGLLENNVEVSDDDTIG